MFVYYISIHISKNFKNKFSYVPFQQSVKKHIYIFVKKYIYNYYIYHLLTSIITISNYYLVDKNVGSFLWRPWFKYGY
jgi:hypothetical protein